jgi:pyruvyltransferase
MLRKISKFFYHISIYFFKSDDKYVKLYWFNKEINFGDTINPYIVEQLSHKKIVWVSPKYVLGKHFLVIGSILDDSRKNSIIWGSGFISNRPKRIKQFLKICAVRGPKSRELYLKNGIECPEVYGDPALLMPRFYTPKVQKRYKIGIIPHYVDKECSWLKQFEEQIDIKIIDIQQEDSFNFIDEVNECDLIISSSLHGLIISDAYGIPSIWIQFSDKIIGENFKFYDYFESVHRDNEQCYFILENSTLKDIVKYKKEYKIDIDLDKLIAACPFSVD